MKLQKIFFILSLFILFLLAGSDLYASGFVCSKVHQNGERYTTEFNENGGNGRLIITERNGRHHQSTSLRNCNYSNSQPFLVSSSCTTEWWPDPSQTHVKSFSTQRVSITKKTFDSKIEESFEVWVRYTKSRVRRPYLRGERNFYYEEHFSESDCMEIH